MGVFKDRFERLSAQRVEISVEEWGLSFFVGPLTFSQYQQIEAAGEKGPTEQGFSFIEVCAKNEKGEPRWAPAELLEMRNYGESNVIAKVALEIRKAHNIFLAQDAEKKS